MNKLQEPEFSAIKKALHNAKGKFADSQIRNLAHLMSRSVATIQRVSSSENYLEYQRLIKAEHSPRKHRVPLKRQLQLARRNELLAVQVRIPHTFFTRPIRRYLSNRLQELA